MDEEEKEGDDRQKWRSNHRTEGDVDARRVLELGPRSVLFWLMDADIPSLSSGSVGSRFVSQTDLDVARQRREEQWKAAYAR